ncbi:hypothetical protein [Cronobacter sakazakii]|uniref:hypothetical protein n=1 Tax=Cronobacter sakazakii TaxID=28141 RepID=UPI000978D18B|nr:hypothetical protein [Cronobacter sakazakii]
MNTAKLKAAAHRDLLGVQKHANQHRLSRLVMEAHNDELRIIAAAVESYTDELIAALEAAQKRNAELEASHEKLRDALAVIHNTIRLDGLNAPLAAIMSRAKRAHEESAAAAGINLEAGGDA